MPTDGLANQSYNQSSNRITTAGYTYDLAGNLTRGQDQNGNWQRYEYDAAGRLVDVKDDNGVMLTHNGYASTRQRLLKFEGGVFTWYVWGGSQVVAEYTAPGWGAAVTRSKEYFYAGSRLLSTITNVNGAEVTEFQHPDRLGTKLVTNNTANTSFEQSTLPFGTALNAESTGSTNLRFTSYDRSSAANIDYAVNRSYSSGQGRFTSVDPIGMRATNLGNPQSMNMYSYTENNPIDFTDPSGLFRYSPKEKPSEPDWESFLRFLRDSYEQMHIIYVEISLEQNIGQILDIAEKALENDDCAKLIGDKEAAKKFLNLYRQSISKERALRFGNKSADGEKLDKDTNGATSPITSVKVGDEKLSVITLNNKGNFSTSAGRDKFLNGNPFLKGNLGHLSFNENWAATFLHELGHALFNAGKAGLSPDGDKEKDSGLGGISNSLLNTLAVVEHCFPRPKKSN